MNSSGSLFYKAVHFVYRILRSILYSLFVIFYRKMPKKFWSTETSWSLCCRGSWRLPLLKEKR
uniref:Uncharacterized protein n=1 Tax=Oryza meridionalis TaxID=40149 RepID=A0A0E0CUK2_9ORYZ